MSETADERLQKIERSIADIHAILSAGDEDLRIRRDLRRQMRHMRQYLSIICTIFGLFFAGMGIVVGWIHSTDTSERTQFETRISSQLKSDFQSGLDREKSDFQSGLDREKSDREKFETSMQEKLLGKAEGAVLSLLTKGATGNLVDLDQKEISAEMIEFNKNHWSVNFFCFFRNDSNEYATFPVLVIYHNLRIPEGFPSSDEPQYKYQETITLNGQIGTLLPGKYVSPVKISIGDYASNSIPIIRESILLKLFYGHGGVTKATIYLTRGKT